ncbi:achaete-scute homolog 2 [Eurytemora carolleeae]|jgi:achaete-scute complex protein|uniref:achaete-scute homolog 2 n=1 Tax=Eurytemora carolleeae TaxID=1294199 RepID=UPI000C762997|nr:achaete-scute homolog 2 [Eurytemora carolleeae]|eukprot:XP_023345561.1 achaete-scute homolog 2-like [Eurytemora affinis]
MVAKRKIAFHPEKGYPIEPSTPPKTVRRNARERNRVRQIDQGFEKLKSNIPVAANQKKISRVKILSSAVDYIQQLHNILNEHESVCRAGGGVGGLGGLGQQVKQEPPQTQLSRSLTPPKLLQGGGMNPLTPYQGYMHYPMQQSPMNVNSPVSPYNSFETGSMSSGYYSQHSPSIRSSYRDFYSPRISPGYKETHAHSPAYSEPSPQQYTPHLPPQVAPPPPLTQDPTPSSTFQEDDEDILNSIIQWEKY